jgi:hypothetical protein
MSINQWDLGVGVGGCWYWEGNTRTSVFAAVFEVVNAFSSVAFAWDVGWGTG